MSAWRRSVSAPRSEPTAIRSTWQNWIQSNNSWFRMNEFSLLLLAIVGMGLVEESRIFYRVAVLGMVIHPLISRISMLEKECLSVLDITIVV